MPRQRNPSQNPSSRRGHGDGSLSATQRHQQTLGSGPVGTETPRRFLCGDMGDPVSAARSDLFPNLEDRLRTELQGAASATQGSVFHWHHGGPLSRHRLDADFATVAQQSELEPDSDMGCKDSIGILTGEAGGIAQDIETAVTILGSLVLWSPDGQSQDIGKRLVVIIDLAMREREKSTSSPWWNHISIFDGEREHGVPKSHLSAVQSAPVDVPRTLTNALASTKESSPI